VNPVTVAAGQCLPLVRVAPGDVDPLALFTALTGGGLKQDTLLLESGDRTTQQGEKSLLVVGAALRARDFGREVEVTALNPNGRSLLPWLAEQLKDEAEVQMNEDGLRVCYAPCIHAEEEARLLAPSPVGVLRALVRRPTVAGGHLAMGPMAAGLFAYDLLAAHESLPEAHGAPLLWPDYEFWITDQVVWLNHRTGGATLIAQVFGGSESATAYHDATAFIARASKVLDEVRSERASAQSVKRPPIAPAEPETDLDDAAYAALVEKLKGNIRAGDVIQIVPSRTFSTPCPDPLGAYRALRDLNPSPYMFYVNSAFGTVFGASPETAVRVTGMPARVEIRPIAGTRPRGVGPGGEPDPDLDSRLEAELRLNPKEVAEHMMLLDLARNDVARVCKPGTRRVDRLLQVDRYSHVMHLVSVVSGELRDGLDGLSAYTASMNMGTLTGAPKLKAAELLRLHEPSRRGPYGGCVGYFGHDGTFDSCILIRSALVRDGRAQVRAGAGVVYDSDPAAEADETRRKAQAVLQAIAEAGGDAV